MGNRLFVVHMACQNQLATPSGVATDRRFDLDDVATPMRSDLLADCMSADNNWYL